MVNIFSLKQFWVSLSYNRIEKLGDELEVISKTIEWEKFRRYFEDNKRWEDHHMTTS